MIKRVKCIFNIFIRRLISVSQVLSGNFIFRLNSLDVKANGIKNVKACLKFTCLENVLLRRANIFVVFWFGITHSLQDSLPLVFWRVAEPTT